MKIICELYDSCEIPEGNNVLNFIALHEKPGANESELYWATSLISHIMKFITQKYFWTEGVAVIEQKYYRNGYVS